jgi:chaperonin GroES
MKVVPLNDKIVVKRLEAEEKTAGGILLPDTAKEKPKQGKVLSVGDGKLLDNGKRASFQVKEGDRVLFTSYAGNEVTVDGEDVVLRHDEVLFALDRDLVAGVGGEEDAVALLDLEGGALTVVEALPLAQAQHLTLLRLLLGRVGQDDAARRLLLGLEALDHDLVVEGLDFHAVALLGLNLSALRFLPV